MFSFAFFFVYVVLCAVFGNSLNITIPFQYPLFKQCDSKWADDLMDTKTICDVGCLMSSTSMALAGTDIPINSTHNIVSVSAEPKSLNEWLRNNNGYDGNNLIETAVPDIDPERISFDEVNDFHKTNDLKYSDVVSLLQQGKIVIANVNDGGHFVLLTGYADDGDTFAVNDPGYTQDTYSYGADVVGYRMFTMTRH